MREEISIGGPGDEDLVNRIKRVGRGGTLSRYLDQWEENFLQRETDGWRGSVVGGSEGAGFF